MSRVDDTDPRFDYKDNAWRASGQSGEFNGTSHSTSMGGAMVAFGPFTGSSISVFSTVGTRQTRIHFVVDGGHNSDLPAQTNPGVQFQQQVYSVTGLDPTTDHNLSINLLDPGPFTLDFLVVGDSTETSSVSSSTVVPISTIRATSTSRTTSSDPATTVLGTSSMTVGASHFLPLPFTSTSTSDSSSTPVPTSGAGSSLSSTGSEQSTSSPASTTTDGSTEMSAAGSSGPNPVVIGSVTGAIVFFAIMIVSVVLILRRRRRRQSIYHERSVKNNKPGLNDSPPKHRPSLHLSIPSSLSLSRALHRPTLLPTHSNKSLPSSLKHSERFGASRPMPSFLAEDPNDSPIFDIKQRPVSGSTVTTRVTVGTTIGQRFSVPESVYPYPNLESSLPVPVVPPVPAFAPHSSNPSPTDTAGASSAAGSVTHLGFGLSLGLGGTNPAGTLDTSVFSGYSENGTTPKGTAISASASRPLPNIPTTDLKRAQAAKTSIDQDRDLESYVAPRLLQNHPYNPRLLPTTPSEAETFIHRDAGVRLASNGRVQPQPRRELPPPYQDFGF